MDLGLYGGMEFAEKLELAITKSGKSQSQIARETGIDQSAISAMTRGKRRPYMDQALLLARSIGVPLEFLADDALDVPPGLGLSEEERYILRMVRTIGAAEAERRLLAGVEVASRPPVETTTEPTPAPEPGRFGKPSVRDVSDLGHKTDEGKGRRPQKRKPANKGSED